jgi:hypothetical protein
VQSSTSALLPPACDEFLFYDRLPGVEPSIRPVAQRRGRRPAAAAAPTATPTAAPTAAPSAAPTAAPPPAEAPSIRVEASVAAVDDPATDADRDLGALVGRTLSRLKRAILRKDPTFDEADHGFRNFSELLRRLETDRVVELRPGSAQGDPEVTFPQGESAESAEAAAFRLLVDVIGRLRTPQSRPQLSGLKNQLRKREPGFSEKRYGFNNFLSFVRAARARDLVTMEWDEEAGDHLLDLPDE